MKHYVYETMPPPSEGPNDFDDNFEFVIFARSHIRSVQLLVGFQLIYRTLLDQWHPEEWEAWEVAGTEEHLTEALTRGVEGLGAYDHINGWTIIPWDEAKYGRIVRPYLRSM